jgi:hypothetical protein
VDQLFSAGTKFDQENQATCDKHSKGDEQNKHKYVCATFSEWDEGEEFLYLFITFSQNFVLYQLPSGVQCIKHLLGLLYVALSEILIDT